MEAERRDTKEESKAKLKEEIALLRQQLDQAHGANILAAKAASSKIASLKSKLVEQTSMNLTLNAENSTFKARALENMHLAQERAEIIQRLEKELEALPKLRIEVGKMDGEIARLTGEVVELKGNISERHQREMIYSKIVKQLNEQTALITELKRQTMRLKLEKSWAAVKMRLAALKELKYGIPDLDAEISKAEVDTAAAQRIMDSLPSSSTDADDEETDEEGDDAENKGEVGERPPG